MERITILATEQPGFLYDITVVLGDTIEDKYEVVAKGFPANLPSSWGETNGEITWISNFGGESIVEKYADTQLSEIPRLRTMMIRESASSYGEDDKQISF